MSDSTLKDRQSSIMTDPFSRRVTTIDSYRTPMQRLVETGIKLCVDDDIVKTMPNGNSDEVFFFKIARYASDDDLKTAYEAHGLVPCDPFTLVKVNEADPAFAGEYPNCTHWGRCNTGIFWSYAIFRHSLGELSIVVDRDGSHWDTDHWFACVHE